MKTLFVLFFIVFLCPMLLAGPMPDPDVAVPIDGGLNLLLASGLLIGIRKILNNKNRQ